MRAIQGELDEQCVYVAIVDFQDTAIPVTSVLPQYGIPMPDLDGTRQEQLIDKFLPVGSWTDSIRHGDGRPTDNQIRIFVRAPPLSTENHLLVGTFFYLSDDFMFGTDMKAFRSFEMSVTLANTVPIHNPQAGIDRWIVLERDTTWGADGRVIAHQRA
ncbi:hypothetical protein Hte_006050 [Hypoxylon texense]